MGEQEKPKRSLSSMIKNDELHNVHTYKPDDTFGVAINPMKLN